MRTRTARIVWYSRDRSTGPALATLILRWWRFHRKKLEGLEFQTTQYDYSGNGKPEKRYLINAWVPIPADGSRYRRLCGPERSLPPNRSQPKHQPIVARSIDLEGLIDYGWFRLDVATARRSNPQSDQVVKQLTGSYGVAIILFTIVIYSLFFPLKWRSSKAMKKAQKLAPKMKELQEKIKGMKQNDPRLKELQVEQLRLMKEGNPLGGCLPLLIQMPFLFALYRAITISLDFRQATFLWLPDLSAPEPYLIHILPILMAGNDDRSAADYAGSFGRSAAAKNDGDRHAAVHVVHSLGRSVWLATILVGRKHRGFQSAVYN